MQNSLSSPKANDLFLKYRLGFLSVNLADFVAHQFLLGAKLAANFEGLGQKREPWNALKGAEAVLGADDVADDWIQEFIGFLFFKQVLKTGESDVVFFGPDFQLLLVGKNQGAQIALVLAKNDGCLDVKLALS